MWKFLVSLLHSLPWLGSEVIYLLVGLRNLTSMNFCNSHFPSFSSLTPSSLLSVASSSSETLLVPFASHLSVAQAELFYCNGPFEVWGKRPELSIAACNNNKARTISRWSCVCSQWAGIYRWKTSTTWFTLMSNQSLNPG